jgi:hypothetical protein
MQTITHASDSRHDEITGVKNSAFAMLLLIENEIFGVKQTFAENLFL